MLAQIPYSDKVLKFIRHPLARLLIGYSAIHFLNLARFLLDAIR